MVLFIILALLVSLPHCRANELSESSKDESLKRQETFHLKHDSKDKQDKPEITLAYGDSNEEQDPNNEDPDNTVYFDEYEDQTAHQSAEELQPMDSVRLSVINESMAANSALPPSQPSLNELNYSQYSTVSRVTLQPNPTNTYTKGPRQSITLTFDQLDDSSDGEQNDEDSELQPLAKDTIAPLSLMTTSAPLPQPAPHHLDLSPAQGYSEATKDGQTVQAIMSAQIRKKRKPKRGLHSTSPLMSPLLEINNKDSFPNLELAPSGSHTQPSKKDEQKERKKEEPQTLHDLIVQAAETRVVQGFDQTLDEFKDEDEPSEIKGLDGISLTAEQEAKLRQFIQTQAAKATERVLARKAQEMAMAQQRAEKLKQKFMYTENPHDNKLKKLIKSGRIKADDKDGRCSRLILHYSHSGRLQSEHDHQVLADQVLPKKSPSLRSQPSFLSLSRGLSADDEKKEELTVLPEDSPVTEVNLTPVVQRRWCGCW